MSIEEIQRSAESGQLLVIFGAGVSFSLMPKSSQALSWPGLVRSGLNYGRDRGFINETQHARNVEATTSNDIDDLLGAAEFVGRKLGSPGGDAYARWMRSIFGSWKPDASGMQNALRSMEAKKVPLATLNYDTLIEQCTGLPTIDFAETQRLLPWVRREYKGVLHLHGVWNNPRNCVFGIRDYEATLTDDVRALVQRAMGSINRLLFVGCGDTFADPNFSALISWLRQNIGANAPQHYALVRNDEVAKRLLDPTWRGFVEPLSYGDKYSDLPAYLLSCFPTKVSPRTAAYRDKTSAIHSSRMTDNYKTFLLRDCGEMTIEGMRADMDTAQRKFDLEKLFVPLEVNALPPAIPLSDPERKAKLDQWAEENPGPIPFSKAFSETRRMVLLALPGGGKTLLLKRLAVAYASPVRRSLSSDKLPEVDLLPLMIRCREWKEHIRKPFPVLLRSIATITGESGLEGLADALERSLKAGSILLLVDGLDEIHDDGDRTVFVENLEKFLETYPKIRLLVTSREAGFDLIAPCLNRFCTKFKIAPLNADAITALCNHWHALMGGGTPDAMSEAKDVVSRLLNTDSLRRLAENPLLCTMLLVVKHGFGRIPPDRVSLYDRAVEVLLDTWNIKGHEALNVKEAVPQLACVAFELLRRGKQTATEKEILQILEEARVELPMIGRYAKDSPHNFLKRVELRSSLMLEGGHRVEDGRVVPFYQFRHLTFQEYLSAVAAVEGYTLSSEHRASVIAALSDNLISDEWKEVIPMAAVLARSQAAQLLDALVIAAEAERDNVFRRNLEWSNYDDLDMRLPPATSRIAGAMIEEANFTPSTLNRAANIVALFANGCRTNDNWRALSEGPYGPDLRKAALDIYLNSEYFRVSLSRNTVGLLEALAEPESFWFDASCEGELANRLSEPNSESVIRAILAISGSFWLYREKSVAARSQRIYERLENFLFHNDRKTRLAAIWCWGFWRHLQPYYGLKKPVPPPDTLAQIVGLFLEQDEDSEDFARLALSDLPGTARGCCSMVLNSTQHEYLNNALQGDISKNNRHESEVLAAVARTAFILKDVFSDEAIADFLGKNQFSDLFEEQIKDIKDYYKLPVRERGNKSAGRKLARSKRVQ